MSPLIITLAGITVAELSCIPTEIRGSRIEYENKNILEATASACLWCKHPFVWKPYNIVTKISYDVGVRQYHCRGTFCSFRCLMAEIFDDAKRSSSYRGYQNVETLISNSQHKAHSDTGVWEDAGSCADDWRTIKPFGSKTIEEFRGS